MPVNDGTNHRGRLTRSPDGTPDWAEKRAARLAAGVGYAVTPDASTPCPDCGAPLMRNHPDSIILFSHTGECPARAHMDGQNVADLQTVDPRNGGYRRYVTETEVRLLAAVGITAGTKSLAYLTDTHSYRYEIVED